MKWLNTLLVRVRALVRRDAVIDDIEEEMRLHIDMVTQSNIDRGMNAEEARQSALRSFGNPGRIRELAYEVRGGGLIETLSQDLRHGARMLVRSPGFTLVAVLTLTLGIGATTAVFSIVNGVLLNPLPYPQPDQLVTLHQSKPNFATGAIPYLNFRDWQRENKTFQAMAISRRSSFNLLGGGEAEQVDGRWVSAEFFSVLGIEPALGRGFAPSEDERAADPVAVISHELWKRKFGAAPNVVGQSLRLDDKSYTIIGVLPPSFRLFGGIDVYVPIGQWNTPALQNRNAALGLHGIGRLKPGVTLAQAQADLDGVMRRLAEAYPDANRDNGAAIIPLKELMVGDVRLILWTLLGAVGFVLAVACVNVSNLMLARSTGRTREFAIRAALGAGRWRLVRQSLTESTLLSVIGGGLGLLVAAWGTRAGLTALPAALPRGEEVGLDGRVLLFTLIISLLSGMLFGLAPALKTSRWSLTELLKDDGRGAVRGRHRAQGFLVAVEMALALVLLIGAGLMIRSLNGLWQVDPGFRPDNVLTFGLAFPPSMTTDSPEAARASLRDLSDRLNSVPGVVAASFSMGAAPLQSEDDLFFWLEGQPKPASTSEMNMALVYRVEPGYLTAMGIPLLQGRFFTAQDDQRSQAVVVIDEVFARQYFPHEDPIGKRVNLGSDRDPLQIVGVVGHVKQWSLDADDRESLRAQIYEPFRQSSDNPSSVGVVVRAETAAALPTLRDSIRRIVQSRHRENVVFGLKTMNEVIEDSLAPQRFSMMLLGAFAAVALLLAAMGVYGVTSYAVGQRRHELGVRVALGAGRRDVLRLVLSHGMKMTLGGVALGLLSALGLTRLLGNLLYGVSATDPATFAGIALLLGMTALGACLVPALRATRVDPVVALRQV